MRGGGGERRRERTTEAKGGWNCSALPQRQSKKGGGGAIGPCVGQGATLQPASRVCLQAGAWGSFRASPWPPPAPALPAKGCPRTRGGGGFRGGSQPAALHGVSCRSFQGLRAEGSCLESGQHSAGRRSGGSFSWGL
ncbi:unnamed protein product [Natator depressus]